MVKGVNKTVIEINDTKSDSFEKVVLYVRPEFATLKQKELEREAESIIEDYSFEDCDFLSEDTKPKSKRFLFYLFGIMLIFWIAILIALF